jgi:hypothetical protein
MSVAVSPNQERQKLKILLYMNLRPTDNASNLELVRLMRDQEKKQAERAGKEPSAKAELTGSTRDPKAEEAERPRKESDQPGRLRTTPVTATIKVEGTTDGGMTAEWISAERIGPVVGVRLKAGDGVQYGIITHNVTYNPTGVPGEYSAIWGPRISGFMTFNE